MTLIVHIPPTSFERNATQLLRLSMVVIFFWFGAQKFTAYEAAGIAPLVSNSPLTSWLNVLGVQGASMVIHASTGMKAAGFPRLDATLSDLVAYGELTYSGKLVDKGAAEAPGYQVSGGNFKYTEEPGASGDAERSINPGNERVIRDDRLKTFRPLPQYHLASAPPQGLASAKPTCP